jgi:NAD(P)-dependent dehydrogenase (short-subunit alcohol dehydrogenase family)
MNAAVYSLAGRRAIVTGASKGIGKAVAAALAGHGASLMLADIDSAVHRVADSLSATGVQCFAKIVDVRIENDIIDLMHAADTQLGGVDILVNNAGIFPLLPIAEMTAEVWDNVHAINLRAAMLATREVVQVMRARGRGGSIVNMSSMGSLKPKLVGLSAYNASKAGLNMLTKAAALEFASDNIRVNAVLPGPIGTEDILADMSEGDYMERAKASIPLKRLGDPSEVAHLVCFLCSSASAFMTGECLVLDGGASLVE